MKNKLTDKQKLRRLRREVKDSWRSEQKAYELLKSAEGHLQALRALFLKKGGFTEKVFAEMFAAHEEEEAAKKFTPTYRKPLHPGFAKPQPPVITLHFKK